MKRRNFCLPFVIQRDPILERSGSPNGTSNFDSNQPLPSVSIARLVANLHQTMEGEGNPTSSNCGQGPPAGIGEAQQAPTMTHEDERLPADSGQARTTSDDDYDALSLGLSSDEDDVFVDLEGEDGEDEEGIYNEDFHQLAPFAGNEHRRGRRCILLARYH